LLPGLLCILLSFHRHKFFHYEKDTRLTNHPGDKHEHHLAGEANVPILHGPLTAEEISVRDELHRKEAEKKAEDAYRTRQIDLTESSLKLTATNIYLTWVLAVATALGTGAAWYQAHTARISADAARASADSAKRAADYAADSFETTSDDFDRTMRQAIPQTAAQLKSAQTAQDAVKLTQNQMRLDQRAWVTNIGVSVDPVEVGKPIYGHAVVFNSGKTVAKHVICHWHISFSPVLVDQLPPTEKLTTPESVGVIAPTGRYDSKFPSNAKANEVDKARITGDWYHLHFWGN
jgi:hypothetical protein